ncbi:MAG: hypothetical protein AB7S65_01565 [Sulfuricurvum sp.]
MRRAGYAFLAIVILLIIKAMVVDDYVYDRHYTASEEQNLSQAGTGETSQAQSPSDPAAGETNKLTETNKSTSNVAPKPQKEEKSFWGELLDLIADKLSEKLPKTSEDYK